MLSGLRAFRDSLWDILKLIKTCLTTRWFWIPVLFEAYLFLQLWLMFYVHPLTLIILPAILIVYLLWKEEKRLDARYGLKTKRLSTYLLGGHPESASSDNKVEKILDEYERMLKERKKKS